ncbi:hypothetical protein GCM10010365_41320 [Streptomyces poonensis]|uniref:Uncharacterized protein n=1 Tax=Streptomyces poonensis TaxID=68255 RepID=A0A918PPQ4_9ACTN|nr:hypothetical protein GCM10010365_41320 [Streptomyces poonensis]GLJ92470.1 hypothetical protein GCM10017589_50790 [Streptomyces poonensis]
MVSDSRAHRTEAADHLDSNEARQFLSRLSGAFGGGGVLRVPKSSPGPEGADLAPGSALRWPKCECGNPRCPDYEPPAQSLAERLSDRVAEINKRSKGGV